MPRFFWSEQKIEWYQQAVAFFGFDRVLADAIAPYLPPEETVCDMGCGTGYLAMELARRGYRVTAVDDSELAIRYLEEEAARRGLPNIKSTPEALEVLSSPAALELMEKYSVLSRAELLARKEIQVENYEKIIDIEAKTCLNMLQTIYLPAIAEQMTRICGTISAIKASGVSAGLKAACDKAESVGALYDELPDKVKALEQAIAAGRTADMCAAMESARVTVDALEAIVAAELWPVPTYAQMLNIHSK